LEFGTVFGATYLAHIAVVLVHLLYVSMNDFEGYEFIVRGGTASNEEKGGVTAVHYLGIWKSRCQQP
jgi:hypothetical protein